MVVDRCRSKFVFVRLAADAASASRWTCVCRLWWGLHRCFSFVAVVGRWVLPERWDLVGAAIVLVGVAVIYFAPRKEMLF